MQAASIVLGGGVFNCRVMCFYCGFCYKVSLQEEGGSLRAETKSARGGEGGGSVAETVERMAPGRGGGHCLFEGYYPLTNYHPRFSGLSAPELSLTTPYFWELQTTAL